MTRVFVSIGSNINPKENIKNCLQFLKTAFPDLTHSPIYQSPPVGFQGDLFYNLVVEFTYSDTLQHLRQVLSEIEAKYQGPLDGPKYCSRTIDLDLLLFGHLIEITEAYELPRSDIIKFAFVLKPLADLAPDVVHPQLQLTIKELWQNSQLKTSELEDHTELVLQ